MAHMKMDKLSTTMNLAEMSALAVITDKYNLVKLVRMVVDLKGSLAGVRYSVWRKWPAEASFQEWAFITHVLQIESDYEYLVNRLAVEVEVDEKDVSFFHTTSTKETKIRSDLPDRILGE